MNSELLREYIVLQLQDYVRVLKLLQIDLAVLKQPVILDSIVFSMQVMGFTMAVCWLGFGVYAYQHRRYFGIDHE